MIDSTLLHDKWDFEVRVKAIVINDANNCESKIHQIFFPTEKQITVNPAKTSPQS